MVNVLGFVQDFQGTPKKNVPKRVQLGVTNEFVQDFFKYEFVQRWGTPKSDRSKVRVPF